MTEEQIKDQVERARQMGLRNVGRPNWNKKRTFEAIYNKMVRAAKGRAYAVELTYAQFLEFTKQTCCHYCNAAVVWVRHNSHKDNLHHNLDRKNNALGYTKENCVVCCARCNWGKGYSFTYEEWVVMTAALKHMKDGQ
jgi:hypothetical protein